MNTPAPGKGQFVHTFSDPDKLVAVPMVCHLEHSEPNPLFGWAERLYLDKCFVNGADVYHLLDRCVITDIQDEALAALQDSRVLED